MLADRLNSLKRYATPGQSAAYGDAPIQQLIAAYNNRAPQRKMGTQSEGGWDYELPLSAQVGDYLITQMGNGGYQIDHVLPEGADQTEFNGKPFDIYDPQGNFVGAHTRQGVGDPVLDALDGFWDKAIPIATMAFIGGGVAGAAGYGPMASGGTGTTGVGAGAFDTAGFEGLTADGVLGSGASGAVGGGGALGSAGQVFGGSIPSGSGYTIPGLGSSLGGGSASSGFNLGNLLKGGASSLLGGGSGGWTNLIGPALSLGGQLYAGNQANKAAETLANAGREAQAMLKPWIDNGAWAIGQGANMLGRNGAEAAKNAFMTSPDYQFRKSEQDKALERAASARGLMGSGKYLKDAMRYSGDLASGEFGNSFNRLMAVAGMGQTATGQGADYRTQTANAQAAGQVARGNALANGITQGLSMYQNQQNMDRSNALWASLLGR